MSTKDFSYIFSDATGSGVTITVTCDATTANTTGYGTSYSVTSITGSVDGAAIDGEIGAAGAPTQAYGFIFDNAIFLDAASGVLGSDGTTGNIAGIDNDGLLFSVGGVYYNLYSDNGSLVLVHYPSSDATVAPVTAPVTLTSTDAPCFCAATLIATPTGDVAVETLAIGDWVLTHEGVTRQVRWIGRRAVARRFANPLTSLPIRIRAGAIAEATPARDLLVSPDHAVLVDGVLAQAGALVNGVSIARETDIPAVFVYYHIELDRHALILAEGLAAETFIDNVDRMAFDNWAEHEALFPDGAPPLQEMPLPRAKSRRQTPPAIRERLLQRGVALYGRPAEHAA